MPCSDCADAWADMGFRCAHMPKEAFSHDAAHNKQHAIINSHVSATFLLYEY